MFKVYDDSSDQVICEIGEESEARIFAKHYSRGSEEVPGRRVWLYRVEPMVMETAIAFYVGGNCYNRAE